MSGLVRARWTDAIHDEWIRKVLQNRPDLTAQQLARTRELMNRAVPDCLVSGYEKLIDKLELPDPDDRHVLAAAIHARANVIVTLAKPRPEILDTWLPGVAFNSREALLAFWLW
jgi:hypothetical protein